MDGERCESDRRRLSSSIFGWKERRMLLVRCLGHRTHEQDKLLLIFSISDEQIKEDIVFTSCVRQGGCTHSFYFSGPPRMKLLNTPLAQSCNFVLR
jgi:hypothetical protein